MARWRITERVYITFPNNGQPVDVSDVHVETELDACTATDAVMMARDRLKAAAKANGWEIHLGHADVTLRL